MNQADLPVGLTPLRHKPTRVDGVRATPENLTDLARWCGGRVRYDWIRQTWYVRVPTTEGWRPLRPGMWLIFGIRGEFYPIQDEIKRAAYDELAVLGLNVTPSWDPEGGA